jgi:hypothetical protein
MERGVIEPAISDEHITIWIKEAWK